MGVLLQYDTSTATHLPVASHSRLWTSTEMLTSKLHLEATAIQETLTTLSYITAFAKPLVLPCTPEFKALYHTYPALHPKLCAQLLDIYAYLPKLVAPSTRLPAQLGPLRTLWEDDEVVAPLPTQVGDVLL